MRMRISDLSLWLLLANLVIAEDLRNPPTSLRPSVLDSDPRTLLFEVVAEKPTYLYGGAHNTVERIRPYLVDIPIKYLRACEVVFCETTEEDVGAFRSLVERYERGEWTGDRETERMILDYRKSYYFPDGEDLFSHCDGALKNKIERFYARHKKEQRLKSLLGRRIKPWLIAVGDLHNIMPEEPTFVADYVFMNEALRLRKPLKSLDDYHRKQSRIGALDLDHQFEYLEELLDLRAQDDDRHFRDIIHAFESGNINQVYALFEALILPKGDDSSWRRAWAQELWEHRNRDWLEKLMPYIGESANFVVVGATHLGGSHGLIRLFEGEGFEVRPIEMIELN